ncbi:MAG: hypothetical protein ABJA34_03980 [Pseudonocardiales bacterium]
MPWKRLCRTDQGSTLVIAVMVMAIAAGLSLTIVSLAVSQNRSSGVDRQRTIAVDAAEGGIDATYAAIQSSALSLPCSWPPSGTGDMKAFPDPTRVVATVQYYAVAGGTALSCVGGVLPAGSRPTSALITSTATTPTLAGNATRGVRTMQASVNLVPITGAGFSKAIFGEQSITASNQSQVSGSLGANANLYTNGDLICSNNQSYQGSVIAPSGSISLDGCSIGGDAWSRDGVTGSNATIAGKVISSAGTISLSGNTSVGGTLLAAGAISWPGCSTANKCFANQAAGAPPAAYEQFPVLRGDAATLQAWTDAGYTVYNDNTHCPTPAVFGDWIETHYAPMTGKTLVRTTCSVQFQNTRTISFAGDFALFASGSAGISTSNQVTFDSTGGNRNIYLVVPYDAATRPCVSPGISTDNNFGSTGAITLLVYSPCNVTYSNNSGSNQGQLYSGSTIQVNNNFSLTYAQSPVFGVDPTSVPALSYTVDILYKREIRNP